MSEKQEIYFSHVKKMYEKFYGKPGELEEPPERPHSWTQDCVYESVEVSELDDWMIPMWAACEIALGHFHEPGDAVRRIREELPWEHAKGRCHEYTLETFEKSLAENRPKMKKGNPDAWYKVFQHVPPRILCYEEFFG